MPGPLKEWETPLALLCVECPVMAAVFLIIYEKLCNV